MNRSFRFALVLLGLTVALPAAAQNRSVAELRTAVSALEAEVAKIAAETPTLAASVTDLTSRLTQMEQALNKLEREREAMPEAIKSIDALEQDLKAAQADIEELRTRLGDVEQPAEVGGGGGAGYDDGFTWTSGGGDYTLKVGGFVQWRMYGSLAEDGAGDLGRSAEGFAFRRTRFHFGGTAKGVEFFVLADPRLDQALVDYWVRVPMSIYGVKVRATFGQGRTPFTRNFMTWAPDTLFTERPRVIDDFRYDRSVGVGLDASFLGDRLWAYVGVTNGAGRGQVNENLDFATIARVEGAVLGKRPERYSYGDIEHSAEPVLVLGTGIVHDLAAVPASIAGIEVGQRDVDANGDIDNVRIISMSADALFRLQGFELAVEGVYRRENWGTVFDHPDNSDVGALFEFDGKRNYLGLYADASYAWHSLVFGARLAHHRQAVLLSDGRERSEPPKSKRLVEASAVVQRYWGQTKRRFYGLQYTYLNNNNKDDPEVLDDEEHRAIAEVQLVW